MKISILIINNFSAMYSWVLASLEHAFKLSNAHCRGQPANDYVAQVRGLD